MLKNVLLFVSIAILIVGLSAPYYPASACPRHETERTSTNP